MMADHTLLLSDAMRRIGRLESQDSQILPVLGEVSEAIKAMTGSMLEVKDNVKVLFNLVNDVRISTSSYGERISKIESGCMQCGIEHQEEIEKARLKAEAIIESERVKAEAILVEKRQAATDRRNRVFGIVGGAVASILVAVLLAWFKLK